MVQEALPRLTVLGRDESGPVDEDELIFEFPSPVEAIESVETPEYPTAAQVRVAEFFAALQIHESRHSEPAFQEYIAFDTETTELDRQACEVIELAAVRVRAGTIID